MRAVSPIVVKCSVSNNSLGIERKAAVLCRFCTQLLCNSEGFHKSKKDRDKKRAGHMNPVPSLYVTFPKLRFGGMSYLLVDGGVAGGVGGVGAFVFGGVVGVVLSSLLQPVSIAPITRPVSTIRVYILFIGRRNLYQKV